MYSTMLRARRATALIAFWSLNYHPLNANSPLWLHVVDAIFVKLFPELFTSQVTPRGSGRVHPTRPARF